MVGSTAANGYFAAMMGRDSADGTFLRFAPTINLPPMLGWLHQLDLTPVLNLNGTLEPHTPANWPRYASSAWR
jgi:hypothetical protein